MAKRFPDPRAVSSTLSLADVRLHNRAARGDAAALAILLTRHRPLVLSELPRYRRQGVDDDDLVQEGMLALCKALGRFDASRGFAVSTYAMPWIRSALSHAVRAAAAKKRSAVRCHPNLSRFSTDRPEPLDALIAEEQRARVESMRRLPP